MARDLIQNEISRERKMFLFCFLGRGLSGRVLCVLVPSGVHSLAGGEGRPKPLLKQRSETYGQVRHAFYEQNVIVHRLILILLSAD